MSFCILMFWWKISLHKELFSKKITFFFQDN
jgi:hypothetical protein